MYGIPNNFPFHIFIKKTFIQAKYLPGSFQLVFCDEENPDTIKVVIDGSCTIELEYEDGNVEVFDGNDRPYCEAQNCISFLLGSKVDRCQAANEKTLSMCIGGANLSLIDDSEYYETFSIFYEKNVYVV